MSKKENGGGCGVILVCIIVISLIIWAFVSCNQARKEREAQEKFDKQMNAVAGVLMGAAVGVAIGNSQNNSSRSRSRRNYNTNQNSQKNNSSSTSPYRQGWEPKTTDYYYNGQHIGTKTKRRFGTNSSTTYKDSSGNSISALE